MRVFVLPFFLVTSAFSFAVAQREDFSSIDFRRADSVAQLYSGHQLENLKGLSDKLTIPFSTEVEKFRAIYTWVCLNIEYDNWLYLRNKQHRARLKDQPEALKAWNKELNIEMFKKLRENKATVCTGYAYLLKELSFFAGITCVIVDGYGKTLESNIRGEGVLNHSWNAVQLNNKWYLCDATWSSGAYDLNLNSFIKDYDDSYFLLEPDLFIRNHYPKDSTWTLLNARPSLAEFLNGPLVHTGIFWYKINQLYPETFDVAAEKGKPVPFTFGGLHSKAIKEVKFFVVGPRTHYIKFKPLREDTGLYRIDYAFKSKGTYIVDAYFDGKFVFRYTIKVV